MKNIKPKDLDVILSSAVISNSYDNELCWGDIIEQNWDDVIDKVVEIFEDQEGAIVTTCVGINRDGSLFTWEYVGEYEEPMSVYNEKARLIKIIKPWDWTDYEFVRDSDKIGETKEEIMYDLMLDYRREFEKELETIVSESKNLSDS